jgi:hypothetical protein
MKIVFLAITVIVLVVAFSIINAYNLDLNNSADRSSFAKNFVSWFVKVGKGAAKVVGFAVKQDWKPELNTSNITNSSLP